MTTTVPRVPQVSVAHANESSMPPMVEPIFRDTTLDILHAANVTFMVAALIGVAWFGAAIVVVGRLMQ